MEQIPEHAFEHQAFVQSRPENGRTTVWAGPYGLRAGWSLLIYAVLVAASIVLVKNASAIYAHLHGASSVASQIPQQRTG